MLHAYSLRRLVLNGSNDKSLDMLRMYFQVHSSGSALCMQGRSLRRESLDHLLHAYTLQRLVQDGNNEKSL